MFVSILYMDLYCPKCGEPTDNDYFHDVAEMDGRTYRDVARAFQVRGCAALGDSCNPESDRARADAMSAMYDLLGDDMDGAAAMMEDFDQMGIL